MCTDVANAPDLMAELKEWNAQRKAKEAEITDMALQRVKEIYGDDIPKVLVVDGANWHVGVIGIVSAKLAQEFCRPTAVLSVDEGMAHASARAVPGFNWHKALFECRDLFERWGGHANAAGFSLPAEKIAELRTRLDESAREQGYTGESLDIGEEQKRRCLTISTRWNRSAGISRTPCSVPRVLPSIG